MVIVVTVVTGLAAGQSRAVRKLVRPCRTRFALRKNVLQRLGQLDLPPEGRLAPVFGPTYPLRRAAKGRLLHFAKADLRQELLLKPR
jgi:hypothetical protein